MSKDGRGRNSSLSEKPVRSRPRRLVDWINLPDVGKDHWHRNENRKQSQVNRIAATKRKPRQGPPGGYSHCACSRFSPFFTFSSLESS